MLNVAIVGCGKIADQHVEAIGRVAGSRVTAVCDREELMARQLAERFGVDRAYGQVTEMLSNSRPDVVHITTPPQSHLELARLCLEFGAHVLIEKPFTVTAEETVQLLDVAAQRGRCITAGHNLQFTPEMCEMRRLVREGYLGGMPFHIESHWSYDLGDTSYVAPMLASANHWVRRLPGGLLHNIISHGIARIAEFLDDNLVEVRCTFHQSKRLEELGGAEVMDELRVLIRDAKNRTAFFCFTTQARPGVNRLRLYGPKNAIEVDLVSGTLLKLAGRSYKSYLTFVLPPLVAASSHVANAWRNLVAILRWRLYQDAGMKNLIEAFHRSVAEGTEGPIPHREIVLTARIMDAIFASMATGDAVPDSPL